jgi:hypothetical protein
VPAVLSGWSFPDTEEVTGSDLSRQPVVFSAWDATLATLPLPARIIGAMGNISGLDGRALQQILRVRPP